MEKTLDNLVPLITNLVSRNRHYVVLAGAGLSIDAGVKSGWDILIETLKPLYLEEKKLEELPEDYYSLIDKWYSKHKNFSKMGYSEILELVYEGDLERREYLKKFFVDTVPGESHRQLAQMVNNKLVRFIFTTNFDDLIEKALEEIGLNDYDVIYTKDQLEQSISWEKVRTCRIYKLHGHYKSGKIRNTLEELKSLSDGIKEDFQYIIDRHGMIVIGYAGRDAGIMKHLHERSPFPYPLYWQFKSYPNDNEEFKFFYELVDMYKNDHGREIHFVQDDSAANFIRRINDGITRHERYIAVAEEDSDKFQEIIINSNNKKIKALSIDLTNKFSDLYQEYLNREDKDNHFTYKYEIFTEFISKIGFILDYLSDLLTYDEDNQAEWLIDKLIKSVTSHDWYSGNEFMRKSTPYYLIMNLGALSLQFDKLSIVNQLFDLEYKKDSGKFRKIMMDVSYQGEGWNHIGQEHFDKRYHLPKYTIIEENLLPKIITIEQFNIFDSFVTLYIIFNNLNYYWVTGSGMRWSRTYLTDVYSAYFKSNLIKQDDYDIIIEKLNSLYERLRLDLGQGVKYLIETLQEERAQIK